MLGHFLALLMKGLLRTPLQVLSCEFYKTFQNSYSVEPLSACASDSVLQLPQLYHFLNREYVSMKCVYTFADTYRFVT